MARRPVCFSCPGLFPPGRFRSGPCAGSSGLSVCGALWVVSGFPVFAPLGVCVPGLVRVGGAPCVSVSLGRAAVCGAAVVVRCVSVSPPCGVLRAAVVFCVACPSGLSSPLPPSFAACGLCFWVCVPAGPRGAVCVSWFGCLCCVVSSVGPLRFFLCPCFLRGVPPRSVVPGVSVWVFQPVSALPPLRGHSPEEGQVAETLANVLSLVYTV